MRVYVFLRIFLAVGVAAGFFFSGNKNGPGILDMSKLRNLRFRTCTLNLSGSNLYAEPVPPVRRFALLCRLPQYGLCSGVASTQR